MRALRKSLTNAVGSAADFGRAIHLVEKVA